MNIGFIGAGKVGCSLGKYFAEGNLAVKGYYSQPMETSHEAAHFTNTCSYDTAEALIRECDVVFITVPDGVITSAWEEIRDTQGIDLKDKIICHCSGAMTAGDAFPGIEETGALGYSVHPLFAVSDKYNTYKELPDVFFTLEGAPEKIDQVADMVRSLGNQVRIIDGANKTLYHCAAVVSSNLVCGIIDMSMGLMEKCGFTGDDARIAMASLIRGNVEHVLEVGPTEGLTGPIERNDTGTVAKHLACLDERDTLEEREVYRALSRRLTDMASRRHPDRDYSGMYQLLEEREDN